MSCRQSARCVVRRLFADRRKETQSETSCLLGARGGVKLSFVFKTGLARFNLVEQTASNVFCVRCLHSWEWRDYSLVGVVTHKFFTLCPKTKLT